MTDVDLSVYEVPLTHQEETALGWIREALDLRHGAANDPQGTIKGVYPETVPEIMDLLRRVRTRSDRVDGLLGAATQALARSRRAQDEAAFQAESALYNATTERAGRRREFESGREREADAKTATIEQRRAAHQASRLVGVTKEAYDVISQVHWQLDGIRKELTAQIRALQFESSLER